jgi:chromosome segregation ATPase
MEMMDEFLLQEGYIEDQLQQQLEQVEKQRQESKAEIEQLTAEKKEIESRIETSLELLVDGRVPKERIIIKMQQDEQKLRDLQNKIIKQEEIKAPTAEDLEVFRNQLRMQVEGELDIDTKKSVLVHFHLFDYGVQDGFFCVYIKFSFYLHSQLIPEHL